MAQHPDIVRSIQGFNLAETLMAVGGMLTLPELQSNGVRLEVLVNMVVMHAKGDAIPKATRIANWFTALDNGACGRLEDPAEDVFIGHVNSAEENFRLFEGVAEGNASNVQRFLDVLNYMPSEGWCADLKNSVYALLKFSEVVAQKCNLERYELGNSTPVAGLQKVSAETFASIKERVCFTDDELIAKGIDLQALEPFCFNLNERDEVSKGAFGQSILEKAPLYRENNRIIMMLPNLVGIAVRRHIIETCIANGRRKVFGTACQAMWRACFSNSSNLK